MRRAEIITAFILGLFSLYFMWKSGEPPSWNPDVGRFKNIGFDDSGTPGSGFWPFWLGMIMFVCCLWISINWILKKSPASKSTEPFLDNFGRKNLFVVSIGLLGFLGVIHIIGFYGAPKISISIHPPSQGFFL